MEEVFQVFVKKCVATDFFFEIFYIVLARQFTVDEQVGNFGKALLGCELLNWITAVTQNSLVAIDVGDGRSSRCGIGKAVVQGVQPG